LAQKLRSSTAPVYRFVVPSRTSQRIVNDNVGENIWAFNIKCDINHKEMFVAAICSNKPELIGAVKLVLPTKRKGSFGFQIWSVHCLEIAVSIR